MKRSLLGGVAILGLSTTTLATPAMAAGPMDFTPISGSAYGSVETPAAPFVIPVGMSQTVVADETDLDIYDSLCAGLAPIPGILPNGLILNTKSDWLDMTVSNETGPDAGRYLYRTHEVRPFLYDTTCSSTAAAKAAFAADGGGALSVIDTQTGAATVLAQRVDWDALDGLVWTPWGTLLFAEETLVTELPDPVATTAQAGLLYELSLANPTTMASVSVRPLLGALAHEGIELDAQGNVYVIDEDRAGSIYRFVPTTPGDLSAGQLQVLKVTTGKTGAATWVDIDMTQAQIKAKTAATAVGATQYCRPEDMDRIGTELYVALTCEDVANPSNATGSGPGAVLSIDISSPTAPVVDYFVSPAASVGNVPTENRAGAVTGFFNPDNLANGPDGNLWIVEDNMHSDIWVAQPDANNDGKSDGVTLFASLKDPNAEATGIYFGSDPNTLFVNTQHATSGNDSTFAINALGGPGPVVPEAPWPVLVLVGGLGISAYLVRSRRPVAAY